MRRVAELPSRLHGQAVKKQIEAGRCTAILPLVFAGDLTFRQAECGLRSSERSSSDTDRGIAVQRSDHPSDAYQPLARTLSEQLALGIRPHRAAIEPSPIVVWQRIDRHAADRPAASIDVMSIRAAPRSRPTPAIGTIRCAVVLAINTKAKLSAGAGRMLAQMARGQARSARLDRQFGLSIYADGRSVLERVAGCKTESERKPTASNANIGRSQWPCGFEVSSGLKLTAFLGGVRASSNRPRRADRMESLNYSRDSRLLSKSRRRARRLPARRKELKISNAPTCFYVASAKC